MSTTITLSDAARRLGGEVCGRQIVCPGPGHSPRDRSLCVRLDPEAPDGYVVHSFAGDDPLACRDHVRDRLGLPPWAPGRCTRYVRRPAPRARLAADDGHRERIARAGTIWGATVDPRGTPAERYLRSRGLALDGDLAEVVRWHPESRAMVAIMRDIITDTPCGVHRTYLDGAGRKIERRMLGRARRAAIKLDADGDVTTGLIIGEGVETCLTARQAGLRPVWALGSAGAIAAFPVLAGVEAITILAEHDNTGTNRRAAEQCAGRYLAAGREVWIVDPPRGDINDIIDRRAA